MKSFFEMVGEAVCAGWLLMFIMMVVQDVVAKHKKRKNRKNELDEFLKNRN